MQSPVTVAVPDAFAADLIDVLKAGMPQGWTLRFPTRHDPAGREAALVNADVVFAMWAPISRQMMEGASRLKLIQKLGAGVDRIDIDYCRERRIAVAKLAGINAVSVAEHVVLLMLAALRQLPRSQSSLREGIWGKEEARAYQRELRNKTVGLIGVGNIGREVAKRLQPFDVTLVYHDIVRLSGDAEAEYGLQYRDLDDLVAIADIISLHVPLTDETRHLMNEERFGAMKQGGILINCARGGLVDETALSEALDVGRISLAGLDTFAEEPPTDLGLISRPDVIATPHSAGATRDNFVHVVARAVENAARYLDGRGLPFEDSAYTPE